MEKVWSESPDFLQDCGEPLLDHEAMDLTHDTTTHAIENAGPAGAGSKPDRHHWQEAGDAWGRRANDWACLFEHYAIDVTIAMLDRLGVGPGTALLDVACGSGLAIRLAHGTGATTAGIDAAASLVAIARSRTPEADIRLGDMFELPWEDDAFDRIISVNGIWGECDAALVEAHRVLRPGGAIAISFWGDGHLDLRPCFKAFATNAPAEHLDGMRRTNKIAWPGVAEAMLQTAGFDVVQRGGRTSTLEWPDEETAWRALSSVGPAVPALENVGPDVLRAEVIASIQQIRDEHGIYRFQNDHQFVIARKA